MPSQGFDFLRFFKINFSLSLCFEFTAFLKIYLFLILFIFGCVGSSLLRGLSLVAASRGYSSLWCAGFSLWWLLLLRSTGCRSVGFSSCGSWAQQLWHTGSRAQAQQLWRTGLVAPWHVGSFRTRDQTRGLIFPDQGSNPVPMQGDS